MTKDTYSAIPGRGVQAAYEAVKKSLRTDFENTQWCLKIDIRKYYPSIPKDKLKETYERLFKDRGIDFVGYVFRHGVIRLRKSIVKTLRRLCLNVRRRARRGHLINYSMFCAFGSLTGWLGHCNSAGLRRRYVMPIEHKMTEYHLKVIKGNKNGGLKKCA